MCIILLVFIHSTYEIFIPVNGRKGQKVTNMKKIIDVRIDGKETSVFEDSIDCIKAAGFEVEPIPIIFDDEEEDLKHLLIDVRYEREQKRRAEEWEKKLNEIESNSKESITPELYGYLLGVFATLSSILGVVINYHFYGKLYERFHNKK